MDTYVQNTLYIGGGVPPSERRNYRKLGNQKRLSSLEVAFAVEPVFHAGAETVEGNTVADLQQTVFDRQGVVKYGVVGEVAHREVVYPGDGAGFGLACGVGVFDLHSAGEHALYSTT